LNEGKDFRLEEFRKEEVGSRVITSTYNSLLKTILKENDYRSGYVFHKLFTLGEEAKRVQC
jgi:hypothetical protein